MSELRTKASLKIHSHPVFCKAIHLKIINVKTHKKVLERNEQILKENIQLRKPVKKSTLQHVSFSVLFERKKHY